jgi:hypothetical protein
MNGSPASIEPQDERRKAEAEEQPQTSELVRSLYDFSVVPEPCEVKAIVDWDALNRRSY